MNKGALGHYVTRMVELPNENLALVFGSNTGKLQLVILDSKLNVIKTEQQIHNKFIYRGFDLGFLHDGRIVVVISL